MALSENGSLKGRPDIGIVVSMHCLYQNNSLNRNWKTEYCVKVKIEKSKDIDALDETKQFFILYKNVDDFFLVAFFSFFLFE